MDKAKKQLSSDFSGKSLGGKSVADSSLADNSLSGVTTDRSTLVIFLIVLLGLIQRLVPLLSSNFGIESDEAIVGLMGKHILEGRSWPVFYYGQAYMGSLEGTLAALSFWLFGISNFALKLVPLIFSLIFIYLVYRLSLRFLAQRAALCAALLTALAPSALVVWSSKARGGYIELLVLGTLALIWTIDTLRQKCLLTGCLKKTNFLKLGLLLGFSWWVNNQVIFYMLAIAPVLAIYLALNCRALKSLTLIGMGIIGFFIGGFPFWYYNLTSNPPFESISFLFGNTGSGDFLSYLWGFFTTSLPIVFGARKFWSRGLESDLFPGESCIAYVTYAACVGYFLWVCFRKQNANPDRSLTYRYELFLLLGFLVIVPLIFSMTSFGALSEAPRYLLPIYSVLFVIVAIVVSDLYRSGDLLKRFVGGGLLCVILALNISSNWLKGITAYDQPFVYKGKRVAKDHSPLYAWLEEQNYNYIATNYWIGYRVAFETQERVLFRRYGEPRTIRIADYETPTSERMEFPVYVLVPGQDVELAEVLSQQGINFRRTVVGEYVVIDQLAPAYKRGSKLKLQATDFHASMRPDWLNSLVDGDLGSRWGSGSPQTPGMEVAVSFPNPTTITGARMDFGLFEHDRPRGLLVEAELENGERCVLYSSEVDGAFWEGMRGGFDLYLPPTRVKSLRFVQTASHPILDWSIAELEIYGVE